MDILHKKNSLLVVLGTLGLLYMAPTQAKHVAPKFVGSWYDAVEVELDNCHTWKASAYSNRADTPVAVAAAALGNPPRHNGCKWEALESRNGIHSTPPIDFVGDRQDWENIREKGINAQYWWRTCYTSHRFPVDTISVTVYPLYACPAGSRSSWDKEDERRGCSTTPTLCDGDIVGRDLKLVGFGRLGHVGLTKRNLLRPGDLVWEILNASPKAIKENTFKNFKKASLYWGNKHGLPHLPFLTERQGGDILLEVMNQASCDEVQYTQMPLWHPCDENGKAVFRCDTLVAYTYLKKVGYSLPVFLPVTLFSFFLHYRDGSPLLEARSTTNDDKKSSIINKSETVSNLAPTLSIEAERRFTNLASGQEVEAYIKNLLSQKGAQKSIADLDVAAYYLIKKGNKIPRDKKIKFIWSIAKEKHAAEDIVFGYFTDLLGFFYPIEFIDDFIQEFEKQKNFSNKIHLLHLLEDIATPYSDNLYAKEHSLNKNREANLLKIQRFFKRQLFQSKDPALLEIIILGYARVFPLEQTMLDINEVFKRTDVDGELLKRRMYSIQGFHTGQLRKIFSSQEMQKKYFAAFLRDVEMYREQKMFGNSLGFFFQHADNTNQQPGFDPSKIDDAARPLMLSYLDKNKPKPFFNSAKHLFKSYKNRDYSEWLRVYTVFQSKSRAECTKRIAANIMENTNLNYKIMMLKEAGKPVLSNITTAELLSLYKQIQEKIKQLEAPTQNYTDDMFWERQWLLVGNMAIKQILQERNISATTCSQSQKNHSASRLEIAPLRKSISKQAVHENTSLCHPYV